MQNLSLDLSPTCQQDCVDVIICVCCRTQPARPWKMCQGRIGAEHGQAHFHGDGALESHLDRILTDVTAILVSSCLRS
jgi:hypothetical protein